MKLAIATFLFLTMVGCTKKVPEATTLDGLLQVKMEKRAEQYVLPVIFEASPACALGEIDAMEMDSKLVSTPNILITVESASHIIYRKSLGQAFLGEKWDLSFNPTELNLPVVLSLCLDSKNSGECAKKETLKIIDSRARVLKNMGSFGSKPGDFVYTRKLLWPQANGRLLIPTQDVFSGNKRQEAVSYFLKSVSANIPASTFFLKSLQQIDLLKSSDFTIKGNQLVLPLVKYDSKFCGVK